MMRQLPGLRPLPAHGAVLLCLLFGGLLFCQGASARTLLPGMIGEDVNNLNARLQKLSYLPAAEPLPLSYTGATRAAVMAFQKHTGLDESGFAGPLTRRKLARAKRPTVRGGGRRAQVDLRKQLVYWVEESGRVQRTVSASTGRTGFGTPRGRFKVFRKSMWSWSKPYKVWMAYASYFKDGYAFHEGDLSTKTESHGCIRIPQEFAKDFYGWLRKGTTVVIEGRPRR